MARVEISETVLQPDGGGVLHAVTGASVQVNERGGGAATVYEAATGSATLVNPLTTTNGQLDGWIDPGSYDLVVTFGGRPPRTYPFEAASGKPPVEPAVDTTLLASHGAVYDGVTDNASALTAAANAMLLLGHRTLDLGTGDIKATAWPSALASIDGLTITGGGSKATRVLVAGWSGVNAFAKISGTYGANVTLASNVSKGATSLPLSTAGISPGDVLLVGDDTDFSSDAGRYKGELVRVKAITSGSALELKAPLEDSYVTSASGSAQKVTLRQGVTLRGWALVNTEPAQHTAKGLELDLVDRVRAEDFHTEGMDGAGLTLTNCIDIKTSTSHVDHTDDAANGRYGYGLLLSRATRDAECWVYARNCRHAATTDGVNGQRGVVRHFIFDGLAEGCNGAWDTHPNSQFGSLVGDAYDCAYFGAQIRGKNVSAKHMTIRRCESGVWAHDVADGFYIGHNDIADITDRASYGFGIRWGSAPDGTVEHNRINGTARRGLHWSGIGARLEVRHNKVYNSGIANAAGFTSGLASDSGLSMASSSFDVSFNRFYKDPAIAPNMDGAIRQQAPALSGGRFESNRSFGTPILTDASTTGNVKLDNQRRDQGMPADFAAYGIVTKAKAGPPVYSDYPTTPGDGVIVVDKLTGDLWIKAGGLLRKVSTTFTPIDPTTIPGLFAWFKADSLALADGAAVTSWTNSAGGNAASQGTSGAQPVFKTNILNGKGAVRFDGTDDFLQTSPAWSPVKSQPNTIFVVAKGGKGPSGTNESFVDGGSSRNQIYADANGKWGMYAGSPTIAYSGVRDNSPHVFCGQFNGADSFLRVDSAQVAGAVQTSAIERLTIGRAGLSGSFQQGDAYEILAYNGALTADQIGAVEAYLFYRWALTPAA